MKKLIALLIAICMMASLAACGGSQAAPQGQSEDSDAAAVTNASGDTLVVAIWDNNQLAGLQKIADEWSAKSGIKVQINVISWVEYWTLLEAGASGGELPDVFWMHINEAQKYMRADMLLNLNDYIAADDAIDLDNYYEGIVDIYNLDGNQFALPKDHDTIALLYNKAIFDKYGVEYPNDTWTWDDYAAAAAKIREAGEADGVYGTAMNTNDGQDGWYNLIYGFGGKLISDDNKSSGMDDPKTIEAMTWLADNLLITTRRGTYALLPVEWRDAIPGSISGRRSGTVTIFTWSFQERESFWQAERNFIRILGKCSFLRTTRKYSIRLIKRIRGDTAG